MHITSSGHAVLCSDLVDAASSVCWAKANLESFRERTGNWISENTEIVLRAGAPDAGNDEMILSSKAPFPPDFNVEFGAYINAIRSSLDILAAAIAERQPKKIDKRKIQFPIAKSAKDFNARGFKKHHFLSSLAKADRDRLSLLEPYRDGRGGTALAASRTGHQAEASSASSCWC